MIHKFIGVLFGAALFIFGLAEWNLIEMPFFVRAAVTFAGAFLLIKVLQKSDDFY